MSRKAQPVAAKDPGAGQESLPARRGRLRAQPGSRAAALAFTVAVVLGGGATAAHAYWSQSAAVSITVTPSAKLPATGTPKCLSADRTTPTQVEWTATDTASADLDARYIVTFQTLGTNPQKSASYAVPLKTLRVTPSALPGLEQALGYRYSPVNVTVTVKAAIVSSPAAGTVQVPDSQVFVPGKAAGTMNLSYATKVDWPPVPVYSCTR